MASTNVRLRAPGLTVALSAEGFDRADRAFKDVRNSVARDAREAQKEAAVKTVLPRAKRNAGTLNVAGSDVSSALVIVKAAGNSVALTSRLRGIKGRALGLLEFGGNVRTPIRPTKKKALAFGAGHPVSVVSATRHYRPSLKLTRARDEGLDSFGFEVRDALVVTFARAGFEVR